METKKKMTSRHICNNNNANWVFPIGSDIDGEEISNRITIEWSHSNYIEMGAMDFSRSRLSREHQSTLSQYDWILGWPIWTTTNQPTEKNPVKPGKTPSLAICGMLRLLVQRCIMSESICGHPPTAHTTQCNTTHKKKEKKRKWETNFQISRVTSTPRLPRSGVLLKKNDDVIVGGGAFRWCHYGDANWSRFRLVTETRWFLRWRPVTKNDVRW